MSRRADARRARREAAETSRRIADGTGRGKRQTRAQRGGKQQTDARRRAAKRARLQAMPPHARRRRRLLRWSWLPALLLLSFAWNLAALGPGYRDARAAYDEGDPWDAADAFELVDVWAVVEGWKGAFNAGTAFYRADRHDRAIEYLDEALQTVPRAHRCDVQTNRALAFQAREKDNLEYAEEHLAETQALAEALAAQEAGEPFDAQLLEPPYEGAEAPVLADELQFAGYLFRIAADDAALAAEALADPACAPPPSQGGGGGQDEEQEEGGGGEGGDPQAAAEQRMQDLLELAGEVERIAQAAADGTLEGAPTLGDGEQEAQSPADAEAERQEQLAERNGQAGGGGAGQEPGPADGSGSAPGGGTEPGTGAGGGGRNW
ncbi:hypothetical protein [Cellulomonas fengjieae]|uniref:hypothetical protein n=1 Tax=Cellulomonas fengjieae TaxID=2819978 RepID=UPI001AAF11DF|nr:hypothetical protein [Cellulomonas fengjieae]MBO3102263.1 hypothetical protein [Cellulomonas fengjieae]